MSYSEAIEKARKEAGLISANRQMGIGLLMKCYKDGVIFICHDGKCIDMTMEEDTNGSKEG